MSDFNKRLKPKRLIQFFFQILIDKTIPNDNKLYLSTDSVTGIAECTII